MNEEIKDKLAPIIAKHGILTVLTAMADRLTDDADAVVTRYKTRNPITENLAVELETLAGAIRVAVNDYRGP